MVCVCVKEREFVSVCVCFILNRLKKIHVSPTSGSKECAIIVSRRPTAGIYSKPRASEKKNSPQDTSFLGKETLIFR